MGVGLEGSFLPPAPSRDPLHRRGGRVCPGVALSAWTFWCLPDRGTVQKVIVLPRDDMETEELMLEEIEVFKVGVVLPSTLTGCPQASQPVPWDTKQPLETSTSPLGHQPALGWHWRDPKHWFSYPSQLPLPTPAPPRLPGGCQDCPPRAAASGQAPAPPSLPLLLPSRCQHL